MYGRMTGGDIPPDNRRTDAEMEEFNRRNRDRAHQCVRAAQRLGDAKRMSLSYEFDTRAALRRSAAQRSGVDYFEQQAQHTLMLPEHIRQLQKRRR